MKKRPLFILIGALLFALLVGMPARAAAPPIIINEVLVGNNGLTLDTHYYNFSQWIELRNLGGSSLSLAGYTMRSLPDGASAWQSYTIPTGVTIPAGSRYLLWADEVGKTSHLSYDLDMDGGTIALHMSDGTLVDSLTFGEQRPNVSYGRSPDSGDTWAYFDRPTAGAANTTPAFAAHDFAATPVFSVPGGLYSSPQVLELSSADVGATIRYTLDGSRPTPTSPVYQGPIDITQTTIVRAGAWLDGKMSSPPKTQTYLLNVPANLPIVSITTEPANLWDDTIGIYTKGTNGRFHCHITANWHQSWERPANLEFFEINGTNRLNQEVGFEIFGNCSRNQSRKSLEIKARKLYGDNDLDYAFFPGDKPMTSYRRLVLRNAGQDASQAMMRDVVGEMIVKDVMDIDYQAYRPAVVYLNGQYWGIYDMREKMDEDFIENNYGLDESQFDVLDNAGKLISGSKTAWSAFYSYIRRASVSQPAVYADLKTRMDVDEFMNFIIAEFYVANTDWPQNNSRYWNDHGDLYRWRWMLRDLDYGFRATNLTKNMYAWMNLKGGPTSYIFKKLMTNPTFRSEFGQRFAVHLNTTFQPARVLGFINSIQAGTSAEMPNHIARWLKPASMAEWDAYVNVLRTFAAQRPGYVRGHIRANLGGVPDANLTVNVEGNGRVLVAGAEIFGNYSGPHFRGVPITLTALPGPGTRFVRWLETDETNPVITLPFAGDTTRTAVYEPEPTPPIVINELHHTPLTGLDDNTYEFLELYNAGAAAVDLSGYTIDGVTITFPAGATIAAGEYIVVADTPATYSGQGYQVFNFDGGLSSSGELVALKNTFGYAVDSVFYGTVAPWPPEPNAGGPSLSLLDPALDNSLPENWAPSAQPGGSPGAVNFPAP